MTTTTLIASLAFGTLILIAAFGLISQVKTERRRQTAQQKSTLAADARSDGPPIDV